jgi:cytoplasmic iron level regulating protein YaaA (DUF328/UPF0246 family)
MLFLLSPAKSLNYESEAGSQPHTAPLFVPQSAELIQVMRGFSPQDLSELMSISDKLAGLNVARYAAWSKRASIKNARQAVLAFDGDVYDGLQARQMDEAQLGWVQQHVCILSGLYGVLRPLDLMQPYRLEMGTRLANAKGKDLYDYWSADVTAYLNKRVKAQHCPVVVNLASQEYFKVVNTKALKVPVVECVFQEYKSGQYKIISFNAKRARGLMARYAAEHALDKPEQLRSFNVDGYSWQASESTPQRLVFRRKAA